MLKTLRRFIDRIFAEEETVVLALLLVLGLVVLVTIGDVLAPVIASLVIAFVLQGLIANLSRFGIPDWLTIAIAMLVFMGAFLGFLLGVMPLVWQQLTNLIAELPQMLGQLKAALMLVPERYDFITAEQVNAWIGQATAEGGKLGQRIFQYSIAQLPNLLNLMIYIILVPILVFFFLKDRQVLLDWMGSFLPRRRPLMRTVWAEMNDQVANYVRGKVVEIVIVGATSYIAFAWLGLNYAALLALSVGLSVVIPYIGAAAVTIPVLIVAYLQWGWSSEFGWLFAVYMIIQGLDGNVLVPLLFSEAVNMHPVAIILAVLVFGGIWGLWGVFFAIPLATLFKAIINAWPKRDIVTANSTEQTPVA